MKKVTQKLKLSTKVVSNLNTAQMQEVNGGDDFILFSTEDCPDNDPTAGCFSNLYYCNIIEIPNF